MRWDIINYLIEQNNYTNYLEIGVQDYYSCFDKIKAANKTSVDPFPRNICDYVMTSNQFFEQLNKDIKYDIVFVDGLHLWEQVWLDIVNSLRHLKDGGTIVVHDCLPTNESMQVRNDHGGEWTGDVWKAIVKFREDKNLEIATVDHDYGCGIIRRGNQTTVSVNNDSLSWEQFVVNKSEWLNVITLDQFYKNYGKA